MSTHTYTHIFEYQYQVETWCSLYRLMAKLTLGTNQECKGIIVKGKPIACNYEQTCPHKGEPRCYLNAISIETRKK